MNKMTLTTLLTVAAMIACTVAMLVNAPIWARACTLALLAICLVADAIILIKTRKGQC